MGGRLWKVWEVEYLCRWYGKKPTARLAMKFGRKKEAVWAKALTLGLSRSYESRQMAPEQYMAVATEVATEFGVRPADVLGGALARKVTRARHEVWARIHAAGVGPAGIRDVSGFDHGTVCAALKKREQRMQAVAE